MRLFFGSYLPPVVIREVQKLLPWLKTLPAKLVELQNLHLTLVWLGEVTDQLLPELQAIGERVATQARPAQVSLGRLQLIPSPTNPRVLAVASKVNPDFVKLQQALWQELTTLKLKGASAQPPHFTLARLKAPISLANASFQPLNFKISEFSLVQSTLLNTGPIYKPIKTFKIGASEAGERYRPNVSICMLNEQNKVFLIERPNSPGHWQLPQGGIDDDEKLTAAALREIREEVGVTSVKLLGMGKDKSRYQFPVSLPSRGDGFIGQEQTPVYLRFIGHDSEIQLNPRAAMNYQWVTIDKLVDSVFHLRRRFTKKVHDQLVQLMSKDYGQS